MSKGKKQLSTFVVVEMPKWKNKILNFVLKLLFIKGESFVIAIEKSELLHKTKINEYKNEKS
jgi:hypothetical protein